MVNDIVNSGFPAKPSAPSNAGRTVAAASTSGSDAASAATPAEQSAKPSAEQLQSAVHKLNDYVQNIQRTLSFSVDEDTGTTVVKVIDTETKEVVRQIPAEEMLSLAAAIDNALDKKTSNLFVKEQV